MSNQTIVDINSGRYKPLSGQVASVVHKARTTITKSFTPASTDGFNSQVARPANFYLKQADKVRQSKVTAQGMHSRTQRASTLMRDSVIKPSRIEKFKNLSKTIRPAPASRISRALSVKQNAKVKRFGANESVKPATTTAKNRFSSMQTKMAAAGHGALTIGSTANPMPNVSHQQLERLLDVALMRADSHKQTLKSRAGRSFIPKWLIVAILALALATGIIVFIWHDVPQLAMKVAAMRAKIDASVPSYIPSGYKFSGPIKYEDSLVTLEFKSNLSPEKNFVITQEASKMDSASLQASAVPVHTQVQTSQVKGTTVYIYGPENDATWVNNGIKYTLHDSAKLNPDQVLKIADSL